VFSGLCGAIDEVAIGFFVQVFDLKQCCNDEVFDRCVLGFELGVFFGVIAQGFKVSDDAAQQVFA